MNFRRFVPFPTLYPIESFPRRFSRKNRFIAKKILLRLGVQSFLGAQNIGIAAPGNTLLKLNRRSALGNRGAVLEIPSDQVIYEFVKTEGLWEIEECHFLARGLKRACQNPKEKVVLLDIGAHVGLVSLQTMNLSQTNNEIFLFEPVPRHYEAILYNLKDLTKINLNPFALSYKSGYAEIFTQATNHGNTSLFKDVVPEIGKTQLITLVETTQYVKRFLNNFQKYVIKCDTQGMDSIILSRFSEHIWRNCESAVIEIWALAQVRKGDVDFLMSMWQEFEYVGWRPNAKKKYKVPLEEVSNFWLSKSGAQRNLFLSRKT